jgi:transcriptional regulator NrdR family protein
VDCPVCDHKAKEISKRDSQYFITTRQYECPSCLTLFKSKEKLMFESLPHYIRTRFIETGARK